jgi:Holliday junction resolvase RusA-like endonuclease
VAASSALKHLKGLATSAGLFSLWIGGKPVPAGRPRVTRWGTYYPKSYTDWAKAAKPFVEAMPAAPITGNVALLVEVRCTAPKKTDHTAPMGDVDNFAKGPMDLITKLGKSWIDDRQIVSLIVVKRWTEPGEEPGFLLTWCEVK